MAVRILFFIWLSGLSVDGRTELREYHAEVPVHVNAPEQPYDWATWLILLPDIEHGIWGVVSGSGVGNAPYMGQLIAGKSEFPFVVDVRSRAHDQELWSIGSLVSSMWVVTSGHVSLQWGRDDKCGPAETGTYVVLFCTNYLPEVWYEFDLRTGIGVHRLREGHDDRGMRTIVQIVRHPDCSRWSREWDLMMAKLNIPIDPIPPVVGYMPIWGSNLGLVTSIYIPAVHLANQVENNVICYVATFGRRMANVANPPSLDFKIKYRVYWTPWITCETHKRPLCTYLVNGTSYVDNTCEFYFNHGALPFGNFQYECFEMRSGEGAVCDHDSGAPMVCSGMVVGFVVRGVPFHICKTGGPFPFVITKIDQFGGGFFDGKLPPPAPHVSTPKLPWTIQMERNTNEEYIPRVIH